MRISDWSSDVCSSDLDFDVEGDEAFLPKNSTSQLGVFTLQQLEAGPIKAEAGLRYERTSVASHLAAGDLRFFDGARRFRAVSASLGAAYAPGRPRSERHSEGEGGGRKCRSRLAP